MDKILKHFVASNEVDTRQVQAKVVNGDLRDTSALNSHSIDYARKRAIA